MPWPVFSREGVARQGQAGVRSAAPAGPLARQEAGSWPPLWRESPVPGAAEPKAGTGCDRASMRAECWLAGGAAERVVFSEFLASRGDLLSVRYAF